MPLCFFQGYAHDHDRVPLPEPGRKPPHALFSSEWQRDALGPQAVCVLWAVSLAPWQWGGCVTVAPSCCTAAVTPRAGHGWRGQTDRAGQCMAFRVLEWKSGCDTALPAPQPQPPLLRRVRWDVHRAPLTPGAFLLFAVQRAWLVWRVSSAFFCTWHRLSAMRWPSYPGQSSPQTPKVALHHSPVHLIPADGYRWLPGGLSL